MKYWDISWNPLSGCSPCSPGCDNCFAKRMAYRLRGRFGYPKDDPFRVTFHSEKAEQPLDYKKPKIIFVCLMSDIFHEDVKNNDRARIFRAMMAANWHTYLILTKRIQNALDYSFIFKNNPNWRLGITICNQEEADEKIPILLQIPAAHRWVSIEPMLGAINFKFIRGDYKGSWLNGLDWVVLGTESGSKRRPAKLELIKDVKEQCKTAGIPVFIKQLEINGKVNANMDNWPEDLRIREMP